MTTGSKWKNLAQFFKPFLVCFAAGALSALAMAPVNAWYVLFAGLGALYYYTARAGSKRAAFFAGWAFGLGYFVFGLHWIGNALLVEGNPFVWAYPLAIVALPIGLSIFYGLACLVAWRFSDLRTVTGYLSFTASIVLFEWLRGHIFTGFPWNLFGYTWADTLPLVQIVSVGDIYLLTWLTVLWMATPGLLMVFRGALKDQLLLFSFLMFSAVACYAFGAWRLSHTLPQFHDSMRLRIVQPNIAQSEKWDGRKMNEHFFKTIRLSYPNDDFKGTTYIIWPETSLSHRYLHDDTAMGILTQALRAYHGNAYLITGFLDYNPGTKQSFNALIMIDKDGQASNVYNKHHPVPLGEYIPFQKWIPIAPITRFSGFTAGDGPMTLKTPQGLLYSPIICYEVIFPGAITDGAAPRPDLIINVTNDAWYGESAGPYQHFTQAIFRAVEEGAPLARAANTGFSGLIAPTGEVLLQSLLFTDDVKTIEIPEKINAFGHAIPFRHGIFMVPALLLLLFGFRQMRVNNR
jgi:apolipoprotein N-acyltransferase